MVNICNDSIPKNKVSKQTQEESANDFLNNAENDVTNPLLSSLEKEPLNNAINDVTKVILSSLEKDF